ncbi:restriction endonuclease subunit S [Lactococcus lactis]|uniref:restriction endonuclease subunit S n=1 Tax=Lactococcus lactis TaxID=1358 RepID=UPI001A92EB9B|nr:restriction endonuclease subunit S [Lactococcus lactis]MDG4991158.1 restriction endonuclease subunit S [Lactococcus lactis]
MTSNNNLNVEKIKAEVSKNVPELRFQGFIDAWELRKLDSLATFSKGSGYSKRDLVEEGSPIILYGRLYTKYETLIKDVDTFVVPKGNSTISEGNEVIVPASGETSEDISRAAVVDKSGILMGGDLNIIKPKSNLNSVFLAFTISNGSQQKELSKRAQGNSVVHLYNSELKKVNLLFPSLEEQKIIGSFFIHLDHLITLHQRKLDKLKRLKQGYLQQLFPKNDKKVPRIRFANFEGDWKQSLLGEVLNEKNVQHPQNEEYPLVSFTVEKGVTPKTDRYEREQLVKGDKVAKKYKATELDDIVYNPANLKFGAIARNKYGKAVFSPIYVTFRVNEELAYPSFVEKFVTRRDFIQYSLQYQQGTVYERQSVSPEDLLSLRMPLPNKEEQVKIGSFFSHLDSLITLHQSKLDNMKLIKQALLQKMFI